MPAPDFAALIAGLRDHTPPPQESANDLKVLDATLRLVGEYGERRITIDDVADVSKIARSTIFRRFGSKDALIQRMYQREVRGAVEAVTAAAAGAADAESALIAGYVRMVEYTVGHPVIGRLARAEPDVMAGLWRDGEPNGLSMIRILLAALVTERPDGAAIDPAALSLVSDVLARLLFAEFFLVPSDASIESRTRALVAGLLT